MGFRSAEMAAAIAADEPDRKAFEIEPGTVDPRKAIQELGRTVPKDWGVVIGGEHHFGIALTYLRGRPANKYHVITDFGAIGSGLPGAIGVAAAHNDGKVLLTEGDGSLLMHIQELETIRRHGIRLLMAIINDGGYGAESHKFRAHGIDPSTVIHGRGDLAGVATGFGVRGTPSPMSCTPVARGGCCPGEHEDLWGAPRVDGPRAVIRPDASHTSLCSA